MTEEALGSLSVLGVHDSSERVYRYVLRNPGSHQPTICDAVGLTSWPTSSLRSSSGDWSG